MYLNEDDQVTYLANVIFLAHATDATSAKAASALEEIRNSIGAKKSAYNAAAKRALSGAYKPAKAGDFAAQVSNLADMLYVSIIDEALSDAEKSIISSFAKSIRLTEEQVTILTKDAIARLRKTTVSLICPNCKAAVDGDSKFCPSCGAPLTSNSMSSDFEIPQTGYAIEFCESTSANFPTALKLAQEAEGFISTLRNKKTWYLASWSDGAFDQILPLAHALNGLRNKRAYDCGKEVSWDEMFGFLWCADERNKAYRPIEYCFGKADNHINPWGCKQARMDWTDWARWFSYGRFEKHGIIRGTVVWIFDKPRIQHELMTNLHRFKYCPFLRPNIIEAVLRALPDQVEITEKGPWKYNRSYDEVPGAIKVIETHRSDGMDFRDEYFSDGIRPQGLVALSEILTKAFAEAGISDVKAKELAK
jgi:predicted RNA-binding Zn-ribbon protein involved in translation (DUF1610 family)